MMDYPRRARLKMLGRARSAELAAALVEETCSARVDRGLFIDIEVFDWNYSQYITERFTLAEIELAINALKFPTAELEEQVASGKTAIDRP